MNARLDKIMFGLVFFRPSDTVKVVLIKPYLFS